MSNEGWIVPDWPAPARVRSLITTRQGGVSVAPYASLNLGDHVGDDPLAVTMNRHLLGHGLPAAPCWLKQVHGTTVVEAAAGTAAAQVPTADGAFSRTAGVVCAVMTADCLPVLFCDRSGTIVAAAHAGWRGLQAGILEQTVIAMDLPGEQLLACLGPAIGPQAFEVGDDVRAAFVNAHQEAVVAFQPMSRTTCSEAGSERPVLRSTDATKIPVGGWLADIYLLARLSLRRAGVDAIFGGGYCTVEQTSRFFSYRRDRVTGRMASLIWLADE